jgi:hypothetical protein
MYSSSSRVGFQEQQEQQQEQQEMGLLYLSCSLL